MAHESDAKTGKQGILRWKGVAADAETPARVGVFIGLAVCVVALSLTHLGMYHIGGGVNASMAMARLVIVPVAVAALLYGTLAGTVVGAFAGAVALVHAKFLPANFYELTYIGPIDSIVVTAVVGFAFGLVFALIDRRDWGKVARTVAIVVACVIITAAGVVLFYFTMLKEVGEDTRFLDFATYLGMKAFMAAALEAVAVCIFCVVADRVAHAMLRRKSDRSLGHVLQGWLLLVMLVVFMVIGSAQFVGVSLGESDAAEEDIASELDYIGRQLSTHGVSPEDLLDGYDLELDGAVIILNGGYVAATNDPTTVVGMTVDELFSIEPGSLEEGQGQARLDELCALDDLTEVETLYEDGHTELAYIQGGSAGEYQFLISWPTSKVYAERPAAVGWTTLATVVQLVAVFLLVTALLNRVVVRRIDETNETLGRITGGNLNERVNVRDSREFSSLANGINTTVSALRDSIAEAEQRNAQELLTAKAIQESSLPREFPPFPDIDRFDIYASMKTAKEVGGDFYDFFLVGEGKLGFLIADVSGKGIPASLFMMTAKTQIQSYMEADLPINEAVDAANHQLCIGNDAGMFVTMFACVLDYQTGELSYVNAGHNPPLMLRDGTWEWMKDVSGMPLGLFDGIPYEAFTRQLAKDDMLYLYTDGVTEAMNEGGELFGEERLEQTLYRYADMNPRSVGVGVRRAITEFTLDCEQSDDITMLCLKYGVPPEKKAVMILPAVDSQLVHVHNFIHEELRRRSAPKSVRNPLDIAAEELFVNVCHYAYPDATPDDPGEVRIGFEYEANPPSLTVTIADDGVPYDPLAKPDAVTPDDIADVPIGGLGILMAKRSVDEMSYERVGESNVLTFRKEW